MAGYSGTPLLKKLGIKENFRLFIVNAPGNFQLQLGELPRNCQIITRLTKPLDFVIVFVDRSEALARRFSALAKNLSKDGMIWIAWPKKSSKVPTDLSFEIVQRIGLQAGLVDVKICAVDEVWSGLKFVYRLKDRAGRV